MMFLRLAFASFLLCGAALSQTLSFISPACGNSVTGSISLAVKPVAGIR